jgi:mRNA interferase RelE/StbE
VPVRVELIDEAVEDLARYADSGNLVVFLAKLVRLEEVSEEAGRPLGRELVNFRKIVVGDRDWRIVFTMNHEKSIATVWVIGDRGDSACYDEALRRLRRAGQKRPEAASLAATMMRLTQTRRRDRRR